MSGWRGNSSVNLKTARDLVREATNLKTCIRRDVGIIDLEIDGDTNSQSTTFYYSIAWQANLRCLHHELKLVIHSRFSLVQVYLKRKVWVWRSLDRNSCSDLVDLIDSVVDIEY